MALGSNMKRPKKPKGLVTQIKKSRKGTALSKAVPRAKANAQAKSVAKAAPKAKIKAKSAVKPTAKAKATAKPTTKAKVAAKAKVIAKPAAKTKVAAKPVAKTKVAAKPVARPKAAAKPVVQPKTQVQAPKKEGLNVIFKNAELIIEPSKRRKIRKTKVLLEGELSINNVDSFILKITPIFKDYDYVDFSLRNVTILDLSYIQMLYTFQKKFSKKGKTVTIDADLSTDIKKLVIRAGFEELMFIPKLV